MIKLEKGPAPAWLSENNVAKTKDYVTAPRGGKPSPWNRADIKEQLRSESANKCMYCEVNPDDGSYPAVEHIRPRESFPHLVLSWSNLGWCCTRCNTNKGSYWSENSDLKLLNPYEDEPADHIDHTGPLAVPSNGSERGKNTIRQLQLNRTSLLLSKAQRMQELDDRIDRWQNTIDPDKKTVLEEDIRELLSQSSEFSSALRSFADSRAFATNA